MTKPEITIVIPSIGPLEEVAVYQSFLKSNIKDRLFVQFVYLSNGKKPSDIEKSEIRPFKTHEVLYVAHDRYFATCEENIFRIQDFMGLLKPLIFIIGEDDILDWTAFENALAFYHKNDLEVMAWNITSSQKRKDGTYSTLPIIIPIEDDGAANTYVKLLLMGEALDASIAHAALISVYGMHYWTAYIGNHLYSKAALTNWLQYKYTEFLCSQVYKQAQFFSSHPVRYGFFNQPVIQRLGTEFLKTREGTLSWGWIEDHRTVHGNSPVFGIVHVAYMCNIADEALFNVMMTTLGVSYLEAENEEQRYGRYAMLTDAALWSMEVMRQKLFSKSHYFPEATGSGSLQDVRYCYLIFDRLLKAMDKYPAIYQAMTPELRQHLVTCVLNLKQYLHSLTPSHNLLRLAHDSLSHFQVALNGTVLAAINHAAFDHYLKEKTAIGA